MYLFIMEWLGYHYNDDIITMEDCRRIGIDVRVSLCAAASRTVRIIKEICSQIGLDKSQNQ